MHGTLLQRAQWDDLHFIWTHNSRLEQMIKERLKGEMRSKPKCFDLSVTARSLCHDDYHSLVGRHRLG